MNKIKILAFVAFATIFSACGPDEGGGSPPSLRYNDLDFISPFDTIVAEFNSKIVDIDKLELGKDKNISTSQPMNMIIYEDSKGKKQTTSNKLYFVGISDTAKCGLMHLKPNPNKRDSIVFSNLKNEDGYVQKNAVLKFFTYPILDSDPDNNDILNPYDLKLGGDNNEVIFAGTIGVDGSIEWADFNDYFKISLKAYDSLYIKLSNIRNPDVNLGLVLPLKDKSKDSTLAAEPTNGKTKYITYKMDPEYLDVPDWDTPAEFKIKVSSSRDLTPYLLWVKIVEKTR